MKKNNKLQNRILRSIRLAALTGAVTMYSAAAYAAVANDVLPTGGVFKAGAGSITSANGVMNVNQSGTNAAIAWQTFNVGANATLNFTKGGSMSGAYNVLNFSTNNGAASEIYGRMKAGVDANVWLVNPNGVIIGKGAQIDVGHMHLSTKALKETELNSFAGSITPSMIDTTAKSTGELMNMGNAYVNEITFDGNRVVIDADKLYTYDGAKVELGATFDANKEVQGTSITDKTSNKVILGETGNNTATFVAASVEAANAKHDNNHAAVSGPYLTISDTTGEIVVGYTAYDEEANSAHAAGVKGSYENSNKWRNIYVNDSKRVGFAWVEDSTQLERIGEGENTLSHDFALKDGIAAVNTKEINGGKGFAPIGSDPTHINPVTGNYGVAFTGKFDGLIYDIYGLTINRPDQDDIGLFGHVGDGAVIRNVNLVSGSIVGNNKVGGVVGHAVGNVTIENVANSARVLGVDSVGGIVGKAEGSAKDSIKIINAENVALVRGNTNVGGIAGNINNTSITGKTYNTGAVRGIENYKTADTAYATKTAAQLTEAVYTIGVSQERPATDKLRPGDIIGVDTRHSLKVEYAMINGVKVTENIPNLSDFGVNDYIFGTNGDYSGTIKRTRNTTDGNDFTLEYPGTKTSNRYASAFLKTLQPLPASYNVGGIAGSATDSTIGNAVSAANSFEIYNGVEIKAGYNLGGIAGSITGTTIQNVKNTGSIHAAGYTSESYNPAGRQQQNASADMNVANVGGIVGIANRGTTVNTISNVSNIADVTTATEKKTQYAITNVNKNDVTQDTSVTKTYDYYNAGNVGGIVGSAEYTVIDYANNKENKVTGAANIGGIVGKMQYTQVTNSVNDGGRIIGTGAIQGGAVTGPDPVSYGTLNTNMLSSGDNVVREYYFGANKSKGSENIIVGNIGGIAGYVVDALDDSAANPKSHIINSRNRGDVSPGEIIDPANPNYIYDINMVGNVGGIAGKINRPVRSTSVATNFSAAEDALAAVKADQTTATVANSNNTGNVSGYFGTGGVVGQSYNGEIANSYNLGAVKSAYANVSGQGQGAIQLGGLLGDGLEQVKDTNINSTTIIYNSYNAGTIGDSEFKNFGRHVGGIAGRFTGIIDKVYNIGDIYNASDTTGGIVGYLWGSPTTDRNMPAVIRNSFNAGNITVLAKAGANDFGVDVGGIVAAAGGGNTVQIENAYNLGVLRGFIDNYDYKTPGVGLPNADHITVAGIISGRNSNSIVGDKLYSTGELIGGYYNSNTGVYTATAAVKPIYSNGDGSNYSNAFYVKPEDGSGFAIAPTQNNVSFIDYDKRYDISKYSGLGVYKADAIDGSTVQRANGGFRMYLYDQNDGVSVTYGATNHEGDTGYITKDGISYKLKTGTTNVYEKLNSDDSTDPSVTVTVVGTMPIMNEFLPHIFGGGDANETHYLADKIGIGVNDVKYVQAGTEYNPLQLNIKMNTDGKTLDIDYEQSYMNRSAQINVLNGNLKIYNISNPNFYMSGNYVALDGDITIEGSAKRLNLSSNSNFYGKNVSVINNVGSIESNGTIYATDGNVVIKGQEINNYGGIVSAGMDDTSVTIKNVGAYSVGNITAINNPTVKVANKGVALYSVSADAPTATNGNITITTDTGTGTGVAGNVNLYLGNNKLGKVSTEGNLTVTGKNVYMDSDMKIGYGTNANTIWTVNADDIVIDLSDLGATITANDIPDASWTAIFSTTPKPVDGVLTSEQHETLKKYMLHQMLGDFATGNTHGNGLVLAGTAGGSSKAEAKITLDYFGNSNTLDLTKYDTGIKITQRLTDLNVTNGGATVDGKTLGYAWIANAEQLKAIQTAAKTNADALQMNYALKKDIDASEITDFVSIGTGLVAYTGTFDGRGNDLNSLSPNGSTGLFDTIGAGGTVKNLYINASRLNGHTTRVGLVAGTNQGTIDNVKTFGNTIKDANVITNTPVFIGGLVGFNDTTGIIRNSQTEDIVYAENEKGQTDVGGLAGTNAGVIYNATGKSDVSVAEGGATSLGGIVGVNAGFIKNVNTLGVTAGLYEHADHTYTGAKNVGGIAGENRTVYQTSAGISHTDSQAYSFKDYEGNTINQSGGGVIADAFNDSKVKGWSSVGGVVGKNFGEGDQLEHKTATGVTVTTTKAADIYYVANAADVIGGNDVGGLAGVNNGAIKGVTSTTTTVEDNAGIKYTINNATGKVTSSAGTPEQKEAAEKFYEEYIKDTEKALGQTIYGRNSGKITAKSGLEEYNNTTNKTTGTNVGGLIGVSGPKADVDHLLNGKAASVYGKLNVGGLIGLNEGVLQNSTNLMQNNDIAGAMNVGGIVGENSGIIAKIENTNKYNITVNKDYVNLSDGSLKTGITIAGAYEADGKQYASYFGGILGHNAETGTAHGAVAALGGIVADVVNTANVTIDHPAYFVGGVMGKNDGTIGYNGMSLYTDAGGNVVRADGYLRNDGAVGVINGENKGSFIGGVIGQNNKDIYMTDITNSIKGTVYGYDYVGGIVGQNTAVISGGRDGQNYANKEATAETGNYYKYDVYNNGMVTGTTNVGGLIGDNASAGTIKLAYNTGVVMGLDVERDSSTITNHNIGGIVGSNEGAVDQVFNSTAPYDAEGKTWAEHNTAHAGEPGFVPVVEGVSGNTNVGGLVGVNTGSISNAYNTGDVAGTTNVGSVVGKNDTTGTLSKSYATDTAKGLVGSNANTTGLTDNYSLYSSDNGKPGIKYLTAAESLRTSSFVGFDANQWAFYNNASTPLLKNFLTKAYFVPNENFGDAFTYNAKEQGAGIKVENGHVNVYKVVDGVMTTTLVGEIFAADVNGDHSLADFLMTRTMGGKQLIVGNDKGVNADRYDMLYSAQINTNYKYDNWVNKEGVPENVVNPNMLGYEFFEAKLTEEAKAKYDPSKPIYDPSIPDKIVNPAYDPNEPIGPGNQPVINNSHPNPDDAIKPEDKSPKPELPSGDAFDVPATPKAPTYDINKALIKVSANDVERVYGTITLTGDKYNAVIDKDSFANEAQYNMLKDYFLLSNPTDDKDASNYTTLSVQDGAITGSTTDADAVTADVGEYKWESRVSVNDISSASAEVKELLKNYVLDSVPTNETERNALKALQQKYDVIDLGSGKGVGKSTVTPATLTITVNPVTDIVYGTAAGSYTADATGAVNGDTVPNILTYDTINQAYYTAADEAIDSTHVAGHTKNVGTYDVVANKLTEESKYKNYNIVYNNATVNITPAVLEVQVNDVTRVYGDATMAPTDYYVVGTDATTGWKYGEGSTLASGITLQGIINDGALAAPNSTGKVTNDVGDYTWSGKLIENLDNYVLKVKGDTTTPVTDGNLNIGAASTVTPKTIDVQLNNFKIIYGARLDDANGDHAASEHHLYESAGEHVYTDKVDSLYKVANTGFVNGDSVEDVIQSITNYNKAGFKDDTIAANYHDSHLMTENVGTYTYGSGMTAADVTVKDNSNGTKNYIINNVATGTVEVKHAIIEAQAGGDIYRYYGEEQKYVLNGGTLEQATSDFGLGGIAGAVYGADLSGKLTIKTTGSSFDGGFDGAHTSNVGAYTWGGGEIKANTEADFTTATDVLYNYRFWDDTAKGVTTSATTITGGASYVLPQIIDVKLKDQEIVYGTAQGDAQTAYATGSIIAQNGITGSSKGGTDWEVTDGKITFNGADFTINAALSGINAEEVVYQNGTNYAYNGAKTNNVKRDADGNIIAYNKAVSVTGSTGTGAKLVEVDAYSDFIKHDSNFTSGKYLAAAGNTNYALNIVDGDVKITPKQITMTDLASTITYGEANRDTYDKLAVTGGVLNPSEIAYSADNVVLNITNGTIVNGTNNYLISKNGPDGKQIRNTGDAGAYAGALQATVELTGDQAGNYMLVNTIGDTTAKTQVTGTLTVKKADLVINLNDFKVLYGDTQASQTINADYTRNQGTENVVSAQEKVIKNSVGLVNGDEIAGINSIISISSVNDNAFELKSDGVTVGTKAVSAGNKLYASATNMSNEKTDTNGNVIGGETTNYNVTIKEGSVDILAKKVVVLGPDEDMPHTGVTPFDPVYDDPKEKLNPDAVYVKAESVERTYGNEAITNGNNQYNITVTGLAKWDDTDSTKDGKITITKATNDIGVAGDQGWTGTGTGLGTTANAGGQYTWNTNLVDSDITGLGTNYGSVATVNAVGESKVNRAKLTIQLSSLNDANSNSIDYGTQENTIVYGDATVVEGKTINGVEYTTTYYGTGTGKNGNGLSEQDGTDTYKNLVTFTDENTGYINHVGQAVTSDGTNKITYHHNAINVQGAGDFEVKSLTGSSSVNNPYDNTGTIVTGVSSDGNYDVAIISGEIQFNKKALTAADFNASVVERIYGDTTIKEGGGYDAVLNDTNLPTWDQNKHADVIVTPTSDTALGGSINTATTTNNVGDSYKWQGAIDVNALPDWIKENYDVSGTVEGSSKVEQATITVNLKDVTSVYGSNDVKVKDGTTERFDVTFNTGGQNGNTLTDLVDITKFANGGYKGDEGTSNTQDAKNGYDLAIDIANSGLNGNNGWSYEKDTSGNYVKDTNGNYILVKTEGGNVYANYAVKVVDAKSDITPAELVIKLSDHNGIVYGVSEDLIKPSYTGTVVAGSTYATLGTEADNTKGLAQQDINDHKTLDKIVTYSHNNTGYVGGVGQPVKDADGNTIKYAHTTGSNDLTDIGFDANGNLTGIAQGGNYKVTFVNGEVTFVPREVKVVDPNNPGDPSNPGQPPMIEDPLNPGTYVPNPDYDPFNPNNPPFDPNDKDIVDPSSPKYDKTYDPTNPDDPRNQIFVLGNTVERNEGDTTIIQSTTNDGTPDGKKNYGIDKIAGLPSWITPGSVGVNVGNPAAQDGGVTGPNSTNVPGSYLWNGTLLGLDPNSFNLPTYVPGVSIVHPYVPHAPQISNDVIVVEDIFPWLHRTTTDHGFSWGKQEHWRERKAEVNFVHGGADFFYDAHERAEIDAKKQANQDVKHEGNLGEGEQKHVTLTDVTQEHIEFDKNKHVFLVGLDGDKGNDTEETKKDNAKNKAKDKADKE